MATAKRMASEGMLAEPVWVKLWGENVFNLFVSVVTQTRVKESHRRTEGVTLERV